MLPLLFSPTGCSLASPRGQRSEALVYPAYTRGCILRSTAFHTRVRLGKENS